MKILAEQIERELETQTEKMGDCAICEKELQRIWPLDEADRHRKIVQFARNAFGLHQGQECRFEFAQLTREIGGEQSVGADSQLIATCAKDEAALPSLG